MKIHTFLEVVSDGEGGYLRTAAADLLQLMSPADFTALCENLKRAAVNEQYDISWQRTDRIKYVLGYTGQTTSLEVIKAMEKLEGVTYTYLQRQCVHSTLNMLARYGKIVKSRNFKDKTVFRL